MGKLHRMKGKQFDYTSNKEIKEELSKIKGNQKEIVNFLLSLTPEKTTTHNEYKETYNKNNKLNAVIDIFLSKLEQRVIDLDDEFDDIHSRIFLFGSILTNLNKIIETLDEDNEDHKYLLRLSIILHDAIKKVGAENITKGQLPIIKEGLYKIASGDVSKEEFITIDNSLLDNGLDWIFGG